MIEKKLVSVPCTDRFEYKQEIEKEDGEKWMISTTGFSHLTLMVQRPQKPVLIVSTTVDSLEALMPVYRDALSDFIEAVNKLKETEAA